MSGDLGAPECVPGALLALEQAPDLHLELVGAPETIEPLLATASAALRALGRPNARVLDLPTRFATDWADKGYPVERS